MGSITVSLALCLAGVQYEPMDRTARDSVDLMEINHFYDEQGRRVLDQLIFYDWNAHDGRYDVRAWRLIKSPNQLPRRDWRVGGYVVLWYDTKDRRFLRKVRSRLLRETWTHYDPELVEREHLPQERRRDLSRPLQPQAMRVLAERDGPASTILR